MCWASASVYVVRNACSLPVAICAVHSHVCAAAHRPLLPAVATGTVEERSIVEPVRRVLKQKVRSRQLLRRLQSVGHGVDLCVLCVW